MATASPERLKFAHRPNADGTIDSICPRCFLTIATATKEADLLQSEMGHDCDPQLIARYEALKSAPRIGAHQ
jgi:hypothetical protein